MSDLRRAECEDSLSSGSRLEERSFSPGEARPTLASLVEADLAVAQAVQNLQDLKVRCLRSVELDAGFCLLKKLELLCKKNVLTLISVITIFHKWHIFKSVKKMKESTY